MKIKWWGKPTIKTTILEQKLASPDPSLDLSHLSIEELHQRSPGRLESPRLIAGLQSQHNRPRTLEELLRLSSDEGCGLEFDQLSTQPETTARFRRSDNRKPAYYEQFFKSLLSKTLTKSEELPNTKTITEVTFQKVDITANEDCDVDVEEDIPFVAPELISGIKELLARVELQALKEKKDAISRTPAQIKLGDHFRPFMRAVAEIERQTNRGFDWSAILTKNQGSPQKVNDVPSPEIRSPRQGFFPGSDVHPLARSKTVRRISIMPVDLVLESKERVSPLKLSVQDPLTVRQVHYIHREVRVDAKRDAQHFAECLDLDEMSFCS